MVDFNISKRLKSVAAMCVTLSMAYSSYAQCIPEYITGTVEGDYCSYVGLGTISNETGGAPDPFYSDYTDMSTDIETGGVYTITLGSGTYESNNDLAVWIDYNGDDDFYDASEYVGSVVDLVDLATGTLTFVVPVTATLGSTTMRIREAFNMPAPPDPCVEYGWGETEDYSVNILEGDGGGETPTAVYIYSNVFGGSEPWFTTTNTEAMNAAFGPEFVGWTRNYFETVDVDAVFSAENCFVFLEGSDFCADELESFLSANLSTIEDWVAGGGHLLLNAAPNEGDGMSFGFGGTSLNYMWFSSSVSAVDGAHPIFNGPFTPAGTSYTGGSFGHASISGTGLTTLITDDFDGTTAVLSEKAWGMGNVIFGGMTTNNWHDPDPNAANLRANILSYLSCDGVVAICNVTSGLFADGITTNSAVLHWNEVEGADQYRVVLWNNATGDMGKKGVNTTSYALTEILTPLTTYAFRVKTVCYDDLGVIADASEWYYFTTLGKLGDADASVGLYPNPSNGSFTLQVDGYENNAFDLMVYNALGELVYTKTIEITNNHFTEPVTLDNVHTGMYQVKLVNSEHQLSYPVMIQK